jgi:LPXTG-site transpeptidase (sortase) family protein
LPRRWRPSSNHCSFSESLIVNISDCLSVLVALFSKAVIPKVVLVASVALLVSVGAVWATGRSPEPSSDLAGASVLGAADNDLSLKPPTTISVAAATSVSGISVTEVSKPIPAIVRRTTPRRIAIVDIDVDAPVVAVGLQVNGSMEIPGADEAGWYHYGARPGGITGSTVIAAHVDHKGQPGVFIELRRLNIGAKVAVTDNLGLVRRYTVTERFQVDKDDLPAEELFRLDGAPTLTLITCGGTFNRKQRHYSDNIVIRATPVADPSATP